MCMTNLLFCKMTYTFKLTINVAEGGLSVNRLPYLLGRDKAVVIHHFGVIVAD